MMRSVQLLVISLCLFCVYAQQSQFENTSVIKTVYLTGSIVKVTVRYSINPLTNSASEYIVAIPKMEYERMAYITVSSTKAVSMTIKKATNQDKYDISRFFQQIIISESNVLYTVTSKNGLDSSSVIIVSYYLTHAFESLPAVVKQVQFIVNRFISRTILPCTSIAISSTSNLPTSLSSRKSATNFLPNSTSPFLTTPPRARRRTSFPTALSTRWRRLLLVMWPTFTFPAMPNSALLRSSCKIGW